MTYMCYGICIVSWLKMLEMFFFVFCCFNNSQIVGPTYKLRSISYLTFDVFSFEEYQIHSLKLTVCP